ncbi:acyltransferase family protein [Cohnella sp. CFH 77786]|uniref:acyltransferase family protein n=1 Tax=Cohnella sp. CFH 77786 TaxID=2662265 RepID=UPI001C60A440
MKRIDWLDAAKGIGIILVVAGHTGSTSSTVTNYIFSFHMPLFFFLSGYLFTAGKYGFGSYVRKKAKSLLIPYFVFAFATYAYWAVIGRKFGNDAELDIPLLKPLAGILYSNGVDHWLVFDTPLWFLTCLFLVEIGFYLLSKRVRRQGVLFLALVALSVIGYLDSLYLPFRFPWGFDVALTAMLFYGCGYLAKSNALRFRRWQAPRYCLPLAAAFLIIGYIAGGANGRVDMNLHQYGNYFYFYIAAFAGLAGWLLVSRTLASLRPLRFLGENTLLIMAVHLILLSFAKAVVVFLLDIPLQDTRTPLWALLYTSGVVAMAVPLIFFVNRYLFFALGKSGGSKATAFNA